MENCGFLVKLNWVMILMWIGVLISCLWCFWLPLKAYNLVNKFWGRIWDKGGQKWGSGWKFEWVPERNQNSGLLCVVQIVVASNHLSWRVTQGRTHNFGVFKSLGRSGHPYMILLMYLTVVKLSKPLKTSNELNWTWFCEWNQTFWKLLNNTWFSETRFS